MPCISVNYTAPWDKRYWAKDYADEALSILVQSGRWPAGSLRVEHTDPSSPTHWRVVSVNGIQQPGW
jgi:phage gp46-like protein